MKENIIQILVHEKTKELAVCRVEGRSKKCNKIKLGKELSQKEIDESIMAIELNLDRL